MIVIQIVGGTEIRAGKPVVTIGSDPGSMVAFPRDARVQPQHAVIRQVAGRWLIESQGEGLIRVGSGVPTKMGWLNRGDSIKLSDDGPELVFDPPATADIGSAPATRRGEPKLDVQPAPPSPASRDLQRPEAAVDSRKKERIQPAEKAPHTAAGLSQFHRRLVWLLLGGGLVVAGIALGAFWPAGGTAPSVTNGSHAGDDPRENIGTSETGRDKATAKGTPSRATGAGRRGETSPEAALCLIVIKHPDGGQVFQLGTAFAAAPGRLVTSGAVATGLVGLKADFRTVWARSMAAGTDIEITAIRLHPQYAKAVDDAHRAQQESETLRDKISRGEAGDNSNELVQTLAAIDERVFAAYERQASFDVAVLETSARLPGTLEVADDRTTAPGTRLTLWGVPFALADYLVDPERGAVPTRVPANVLMRLKPSNDESLARLVIKCQESLAGQNWSGSPVLNSTGRVVGIYSRPTPPPFEAVDRPAPATHDVVEIEKLRELLPNH
jgi:hypothetical protein